jgi:hypothetical protein
MTKFYFVGIYVRRLILFLALISILLLSLWPSQVVAATFTQTFSCSFDLARTRWDDNCILPRFDNSLGDLLKVDFSLSTTIQTNARFENLDAAPRSLDADLGSDIRIFIPSNQVLISIIPTVNIIRDLDSFDGVSINDVDYIGPSGVTFPQFTDTSSTSSTLLPGDANFDLFRSDLPNSLINLPIVADSYLNFNGGLAANFATDVNTFASAILSVTYSYQAIDLSISKTHTDMFRTGSISPYNIVVSNIDNQPSPVPITVIDTLPAGLTFEYADSPNWSCNALAQIVTCTSNVSIMPNASSTFNLYVKVAEDVPASLINTATVNTVTPDGNISNNSSSDLTIINRRPVGGDSIFTIGDNCDVGMIIPVPRSYFISQDPDGDSIIAIMFENLGDPLLGRFYLGYPGNGGQALTEGVLYNIEDLDNIFYQANSCDGQINMLSFWPSDSNGLRAIVSGNLRIVHNIADQDNDSGNNNINSDVSNPIITSDISTQVVNNNLSPLNSNQQANQALLGLARTGGY